MENKARQLLDKDLIKKVMKDRILPLYPEFTDIKRIKIHAHKQHIWQTTYHVVINYETVFIDREGKCHKLPIFCSAHSSEPRKNVFDSLKFLWGKGFDQGYLTIPHPLFYSQYFKGTFYRGVEGKNLYHYIRNEDFATIENMIPKAARWFVKLHKLPVDGARNFNRDNSRIRTAVPGVPHILGRIKADHSGYYDKYHEIYDLLCKREEEFLSSTKRRWLVHGDAHPENVIRMGKKKIAVIDFTDLCKSDYCRDIGSFIQQLGFMASRKIDKGEYRDKLRYMFLEEYFKISKEKYDDETKKRINTYYCWTAMRTATYFLIKHNPEPERGYPMISRVYNELIQSY